MGNLEHGTMKACEMPRFDDGMVNIQELINIMAEALVNEIMDAQADDACAEGNQRNGYYWIGSGEHVTLGTIYVPSGSYALSCIRQ